MTDTTYCDECGQTIQGYEPIIHRYDLALDADDGYGDYAEIYLCRTCADCTEPTAQPAASAQQENTR